MSGATLPTRQAVATPTAPAAIGPYSQAISTGSLVFVSGQIPLDPASGQMVDGGIEAQTRQALRNVEAILDAAGLGLGAIVKTTVYLVDLEEFGAMNRVYETCMPSPPPARSTVQVSRLPRDARVEIDVIAAR
jgi:2-iminobutanoate/2-iminopropanoate deaminase